MTLPEDMDPVMRRIRALEKEVASLRGRNPLASATLDDEDGNRRINFGQLPDGGFGQEILDASGRVVFRVDEGGLRDPALNLPYRAADRDGAIRVETGAWTLTWETGIGSRTHPAIRWISTIAVSPGSTYEARLLLDGTSTTDVHTIVGSPVPVAWAWNWAPGWSLGTNGYRLVQLQVRRIAGTGAADVYAPDSLFLGTIEDLGATPSGV